MYSQIGASQLQQVHICKKAIMFTVTTLTTHNCLFSPSFVVAIASKGGLEKPSSWWSWKRSGLGKDQVLEKIMDWPTNRKGRQCGSGTTSHARKEQRKAKQWSALEKADPAGRECLEKHKKALEKALDTTNSKLESLEKDEDEEFEGLLADLKAIKDEKEQQALEKARAKSKPRGTPASSREQGYVNDRKVVLGPSPSPSTPGLEKPTQALSLADGQPLEKGKESLEKGKKRKKPQATVMVDWHNTLEVGNRIPPANLEALHKLLGKAEVHLLSAVGSWKMKKQVEGQMAKLEEELPFPLASASTCWTKTGILGKVDLGSQWGVSVLFDDKADICEEGVEWGMHVYPIFNKWEDYTDLEKLDVKVYQTFAEAVEAFLKTLN